MEKKEAEKLRANHLIWNAAENYQIHSDYAAFDLDGNADIYFNHIIGAVYKYYDFEKLQPLFSELQQARDSVLYEELLWLGLENCVFLRAKKDRPILVTLREAYAKAFLERTTENLKQELFWQIKVGHYQTVLGQTPSLNVYEKKLLDALTFSEQWSEEEIVNHMHDIIDTFFGGKIFRHLDATLARWYVRKRFHLPFCMQGKSGAVRYVDWLEENGEEQSQKTQNTPLFLPFYMGKAKERALKTYIEGCFGTSIFSHAEILDIEKRLCVDNHKNCYLHFTKGKALDIAQTQKNENQLRVFFDRQQEWNLLYQQNHAMENRRDIRLLTEKIQDAIQVHMASDSVPARAGMLQSNAAWRGLYCHEARIFQKNEPEKPENFTVDILLDGSASQKEKQSVIANQCWVIAESLTKCQIPVRILSYNSVSGCTVVQILRDYEKPEENQNVFRYMAAGWNRDGLALRAVGDLMQKECAEHKLLIMLSDAHPNDDQKIPWKGFSDWGRDYAGNPAIEDTQKEVEKLRQKGIGVVCVFTGNDAQKQAVQKIYKNDVIAIRDVECFSDAVGRLLQDKILFLS